VLGALPVVGQREVRVGAAHIELGQTGEDLAVAWYRGHGYEVLDRNWRCSLGEIDVVARRGGVLVVVEVKTRRTDAFGAPALAVTPVKQRRIRRLAACWFAERRIGQRVEVRFDVVSVVGDVVTVYERAFE
jgi:putative endonuclease